MIPNSKRNMINYAPVLIGLVSPSIVIVRNSALARTAPANMRIARTTREPLGEYTRHVRAYILIWTPQLSPSETNAIKTKYSKHKQGVLVNKVLLYVFILARRIFGIMVGAEEKPVMP